MAILLLKSSNKIPQHCDIAKVLRVANGLSFANTILQGEMNI